MEQMEDGYLGIDGMKREPSNHGPQGPKGKSSDGDISVEEILASVEES